MYWQDYVDFRYIKISIKSTHLYSNVMRKYDDILNIAPQRIALPCECRCSFRCSLLSHSAAVLHLLRQDDDSTEQHALLRQRRARGAEATRRGRRE